MHFLFAFIGSQIGCVVPTKCGHWERFLWSKCWNVKLTPRHQPVPSLITTKPIISFFPLCFSLHVGLCHFIRSVTSSTLQHPDDMHFPVMQCRNFLKQVTSSLTDCFQICVIDASFSPQNVSNNNFRRLITVRQLIASERSP